LAALSTAWCCGLFEWPGPNTSQLFSHYQWHPYSLVEMALARCRYIGHKRLVSWLGSLRCGHCHQSITAVIHWRRSACSLFLTTSTMFIADVHLKWVCIILSQLSEVTWCEWFLYMTFRYVTALLSISDDVDRREDGNWLAIIVVGGLVHILSDFRRL